ncbi:two-component system, OmpR family, alkaline phosphatase synthesis response regulator PhoP [Duganella sacchari]|uniref:Two-component system, OmpR family, alkaline phosphatase synthesis response regulator PhoP n=1 Tax=Duganella sacchari TaxID=551987 RepID=A0A1M7J354_9BURK|nr:response regulator [Duganella sacchari]SHM47398.1 two-component system, OmpR family, alkaline phosphatase synthesis response regulator PhoP [Duganella sacchari]
MNSPPASPAGPLLLLVDDEFDVLSAYSMLFEYHGYRVLTANNGAEALAAAAIERPDLVLSDLMMPVMDGGRLCKAWRDDAQLRNIPFILTSAGMIKEPALPYDSFFKKPVRFEVLLAEIERLIAPKGE